MSTYYVSSAGNDGNNGTSAGTPFLTIGHAQSVAVAGDTINLRGGDTFTEDPSFTVGLTLQSYGTGQSTVAAGTGNVLFTMSSDQAITLSNLAFTNSSTTYVSGASTEIVRITRTTTGSRFNAGIAVDSCTFTGGQNGLRIFTSTTDNAGWNNISITNNLFYNCSLAGLYIHGNGTFGTTYHYSHVTIAGNVAHDITGTSSASSTNGYGWGLTLDKADTAAGANTISGNYCYEIGASCNATLNGGSVGIQTLGTDGVTVSGNSVRNCYSVGSNDGSGLDMDLGNDNNVFEKNFVAGCGVGLSSFTSSGHSGNVWRFNVLIDCGKTGPTSTTRGALNFSAGSGGDGQGGVTVHNNTVTVTSARPAIYGIFGFVNKKLYDNILIVASGSEAIHVTGGGFGSGSAFDGNHYQQAGNGSTFAASINGTSYSTFAAFKSGTSQEASGAVLSTSPFLGPLAPVPTIPPGSFAHAYPYSLLASSSPYHAGLDLLATFGVNPGGTDFLGAAIPAPYSAGAMNNAYVPPGGPGSVLMSL